MILVEAKAHVGELASTCAAGPKSRLQIEQALATTEAHLGIPPDRDWTNGFYQYANRLAHLRFMRDRGVDAHLVFVYLIGDSAMGGPDTKEGCAKVLDECHDALGLPEHTPLEGVHEVFFRPAAPNA